MVPDEKLNCAVGIASGVIESFYAQTYPKEFDLFGRALILATRYEAARKNLLGTVGRCDLIILQEAVHMGLSPEQQATFECCTLRSFKIRDDEDAQRLYFQRVVEDQLLTERKTS